MSYDEIECCECCGEPIHFCRGDEALRLTRHDATVDASHVGIVSGRWLCGACAREERTTSRPARSH